MSRRQRPVRWGLLVLALLPMFLMWLQLGRSHLLRDRWRRDDLDTRFPSGASSQSLLLVNESNVPAFAEVRCAAWSEPRPELLLPGQSQMLELPSDPVHSTEVRMCTLDLQAEHALHVMPLPSGWMKTFIDVDESGAVTSRTRSGGDYSPQRGYVGVETSYQLPVRVELPYDPHERPSDRHFEREAWIGPGLQWDSTQCAFAMGRTVSVTLWVSPLTDFERDYEIAAGDDSTRLTMKPDGSVERDAIPAWQRLTHLASL